MPYIKIAVMLGLLPLLIFTVILLSMAIVLALGFIFGNALYWINRLRGQEEVSGYYP